MGEHQNLSLGFFLGLSLHSEIQTHNNNNRPRDDGRCEVSAGLFLHTSITHHSRVVARAGAAKVPSEKRLLFGFHVGCAHRRALDGGLGKRRTETTVRTTKHETSSIKPIFSSR